MTDGQRLSHPRGIAHRDHGCDARESHPTVALVDGREGLAKLVEHCFGNAFDEARAVCRPNLELVAPVQHGDGLAIKGGEVCLYQVGRNVGPPRLADQIINPAV